MNRLILLFYLVVFISCGGEEKYTIPENILQPSKMTDVLVDVHILEATLGLNVMQKKDTIAAALFYDVFKNNQVTKEQYDESMDYYMQHPDLLNTLYDSVLVKLDKVAKDTL